VAVCEAFARGGEGALEAADAVLSAPPGDRVPRFRYPLDASYADKLAAVARASYGAREVALTADARDDLDNLEKMGAVGLPVCVAKTHLSLSDDAARRGAPSDFPITVRELRLSAGAGFVVALTGEIMTMPGLPKVPSAARVRLTANGKITGLMQGD
jgi:formate--tetrahydrofolate ligase